MNIHKKMAHAMKDNNSLKVYSMSDIYKAFDMGLEMAVFIIEKMVGFTPKAQQAMVDILKEEIQKSKYQAV